VTLSGNQTDGSGNGVVDLGESKINIPLCKLKTCPGATDGDQCWCCVFKGSRSSSDCYSQELEQAEQSCKDGCHPFDEAVP
jgi:hypothetical protein